jgi:hypothetical protein
MLVKNMFLLVLVFIGFRCYACTPNIPDHVKKEYANDIQRAFEFQSQGESTYASFYFEKGCEAAKKAGETAAKIEAIRQFFVWYRTYGYYLRLMTKDPKIFGQYIGGGEYSTNTYFPRRCLHAYGSSADRDANIREYLFGTAEVLSGVLCIWFLPTPNKYVLGGSMAFDGCKRIWNVANASWIQKDISISELQRTTERLKVVAD